MVARARRPRLRRTLLLAASALLSAAGGWLRPAPARAAGADPDYADELIAQADALQLATDPQWRALLHYQPRRFSSAVVSTANNDWFFQAAGGKTDPQAEMHATVRRFFVDAPMKDGESPQCALRGRYLWLDRRLHLDPQRLPPQPCERFDEWRSGIHPRAVSLIFPEAYMNNPSSMFGHTLLRVDADPPGARQDLLAYGVNFSADTGADGGVAFAWKGILGYYPGRFAVEPYYDVIKRYGDWESRDIWEYQLTLDPDAVELLLAHLWELRGVEFDYYFFDENCSYQILALLDAARPDLRLHDQFPAWVVPADTVRAVVAEPGLVDGTALRASAATRLRHAARELPPRQRRLASAIADGRVAPDDAQLDALSDAERAAVLGTAYDLFRYRYLVGREATAEEQRRARAILLARSRAPVAGSALPPPPAPPTRPDQGHGRNRAAIGAGVRDGHFYLEAQFRPAYHVLMDPVGGYTAGAQIDFLALTLRYYTKEREARVHRFTLVDIVSVTPVDAFFHPMSWKVGTGMFSRLVPQNGSNELEEAYVWRSGGGVGIAAQPWASALAYVFVDATADYSPALEEDHAIGPGASAGLFFGPASDRWKGQLSATVTRFALGDVSTYASIGLDGRLTLTPHIAITAGISGNRDFEQNWIEAGGSLSVYW